jgi:DNA helicase-2/ATP-dependent DNA helicase PcrA
LKIINELNNEFIDKNEDINEININEINKKSIKDLILKIIEKVNYYEYLSKINKGKLITSRKENIEQLFYMTENKKCTKENINEFLEYVSFETKEENEEKKIDNKVIISTIHKAKGLEYDYVFLPFWNQNSFPNFKTLQEKNGIEEERRLAYVAITRAKKNVFISYHKIKYITNYDKIIEDYASDFINEISGSLFKKVELNDDIKENENFFIGGKRNRENINNNNNYNNFKKFKKFNNYNYNNNNYYENNENEDENSFSVFDN